MSDDVDFATEQMARELEAKIDAARGIAKRQAPRGKSALIVARSWKRTGCNTAIACPVSRSGKRG